jgi:Uma2 family endonuclease
MTTSPLAKSPKPPKAAKAIAPGTAELNAKKRNPTIEDFDFPDGLPTAEDLPCSDDTPVDSELQELIPGLLKAILLDLWKDRTDWLFSIDMAFYYKPKNTSINVAPDGLLSLGLKNPPDENLRSSYVLWDEKVIPQFALEIVSKTAGKEYTDKFKIYQLIGILYYLVYSPLRKRKAKFQLYQLIDGEYVLQSDGSKPYWMPEVGLGIGAENQSYGNNQREWLYWYDENDVRYPTPMERADIEAVARSAAEQLAAAEAAARSAESQRANIEAAARSAEAIARTEAEQLAATESQRANAAQQENEALRRRLRELGIDPDSIA